MFSTVTLSPLGPFASMVTRPGVVGGGPGLYLDFARLTFHVPTKGLSAAWAAEAPSRTPTRTTSRLMLLRDILLLHSLIHALLAARNKIAREVLPRLPRQM